MAYMLMPIYNLDKPVGPLQVNQSDDVRLLQTMFNELNKLTPKKICDIPLPIDGVYSDELCLWIRAFQERAGLPVNGKAMPMQVSAPAGRNARVDWQSTAADGSLSVVYAMNVLLRQHAKMQHEGLKGRLRLAEKGFAAA
ncbi:MAG: peptidoglycan-binding protein [Bryobacterales bacterium]|nr:peptidoglycan-binding protein [Bryobacterales bacterium]